jgi:hypothetical protein
MESVLCSGADVAGSTGGCLSFWCSGVFGKVCSVGESSVLLSTVCKTGGSSEVWAATIRTWLNIKGKRTKSMKICGDSTVACFRGLKN